MSYPEPRQNSEQLVAPSAADRGSSKLGLLTRLYNGFIEKLVPADEPYEDWVDRQW